MLGCNALFMSGYSRGELYAGNYFVVIFERYFEWTLDSVSLYVVA